MPASVCAALLEAREHDPFSVLGLHAEGAGWRLRVFRPHAKAVAVEFADGRWAPLARRKGTDLFEWQGLTAPSRPWRLDVDGVKQYDTYAFAPQPPADDLFLFNAGRLRQAWRTFGAVPQVRDGIAGVCFRVWAPNAERVSVVGGFNGWDGRVNPMATLGGSGVWELFVPELAAGALYRFELRLRGSGAVKLKSDPCARAFERRPASACCVTPDPAHEWNDGAWMQARARSGQTGDWLSAPMSVYEMHLGSWMRHPDRSFYGYRELAVRLVPYLVELGYTHVEFLPLMEHPLDESWGYQCTGFLRRVPVSAAPTTCAS